MKELGIIILAICPAMIGVIYAMALKKNQRQIGKIIQLIDWLMTEIRYSQTDVNNIISNLSTKNSFNELSFLIEVKKNMKSIPFPIAWTKAVNEWNSTISKDDRNLLASLSDIIGASDSKGQIVNMDHIRCKFEDSLKVAKNIYNSKGKLSRSLGILIGLAVFILAI